MAKSLFLILDEMNQDDIKNGTTLLGVSAEVMAADKLKGGTAVKMAGPPELVFELMNDTRMCVMLIIDKKEYQKRINESK